MEHLSVNLAGKIRQATLGGRKYIVAPLTLIVPGVLNGSQGPLYYPQDEIDKNPEMWNGVPIVLRHPFDDSGSHRSARDPQVLENQGLGYVFKARSNGKLRAEGWFDEENTSRIAPSILQNLKSGKSLELSTGLFTDNEPAENGEGNYKGKRYTHVARNYRPDHLAILPDQEGACSVKDGCGVNVNQKHRKSNSENHSSRDRSRDMKKLTENKRKSIVDDLIENCGECGWNEEDRETLSEFPDEKLIAMDKHRRASIQNELIANAVREVAPQSVAENAFPDFIKAKMKAKAGDEECDPDEDPDCEETKNKGKKAVKNEEKRPLTNAELVAAMSPEMKANLAFGSKGRAAWRASAIERITANVEDDDTREKLARKLETSSDESLDDMLLVLPKNEETIQATAPNYAGQAAGQVVNKAKLTYMPLPGENESKAK